MKDGAASPGSARLWRTGFGILPKRTFQQCAVTQKYFARRKVRDRRMRSPARYKRALPRLAATFFALLSLTACRRGMVDQQRLKPLAEETFFADGRGSRQPPAHTVAQGQLREDGPFYTGKIGDQLVATFPRPVTHQTLARGQERFEIFCAACHGRSGAADGMIVQRGFPQPPSLHEQRLRDAPAGHFFDVITHGYGVMYPYASRVSPEDRWAIAAYIRALQLSQHAAPGDADEASAKELETAP